MAALQGQKLLPSQVVVTVRREDSATWAIIEGWKQQLSAVGISLEAVEVEPGPLTAAMNIGVARTTGDLVALTDDDAEPWPDWLEKLSAYFVDPSIGGVGGRDWQPHECGNRAYVGLVSWYGRVTGNHHLGHGPPRDVDLLKGANCCFRGDLLRTIGFDSRLLGAGNVSHWEMSLCFQLRRRDWRLIYDPAVAINHFPAQRIDGDTNARGVFQKSGHVNMVHNETLAVFEYLLPMHRPIFVAWAAVIGTIESPGCAQIPRLIFLKHQKFRLALQRLAATFTGRFQGITSWLKYRNAVPRMTQDGLVIHQDPKLST